MRPGARPRVFDVQSVVMGDKPVRLYEARHGWRDRVLVSVRTCKIHEDPRNF